MKPVNPIIKLAFALLVFVIFYACKKEASNHDVSNDVVQTRSAGVLPDDVARVAMVPTLMSSSFYDDPLTERSRITTGKIKDTDHDGIPDAIDACPTQKETVNGYMDNDGCPDTVPTQFVDTDGDGIPDVADICPTEKETVNGYQDSDGCPDTVPDTDGDGIDDLHDACPTQPENFNGYEDTDGCPDVPPIIVPPTTLPASYELLTPTPGNQGGEGSCVAFAIAYGARSIEQFYKTNASSYSADVNVFSPEYVYDQTKFSDCASGTSLTTVLDFIQAQGVSTWQLMPYSDVNGCSLVPDANQLTNASEYKISTYVKIANTDQIAIKTMITQQHAVIATVIADNSFVNAGAGFIWKSYSGAGALPHTIIICGYDDAKHAYKVMNSWGTSWGDAGFSWIDYDLFPSQSSYYTYAIQ